MTSQKVKTKISVGSVNVSMIPVIVHALHNPRDAIQEQMNPAGQSTGYFVVAFGLGEPVGGWKWDLATLRAIDCGQSLLCVVADTFGLVLKPFRCLTGFTCRFAATVATSGWPLGKRWRPLC